MKKIIISVLELTFLDNAKALKLLESYRDAILATKNFDDVKISPPEMKSDTFLSIELHPKSAEDWVQHQLSSANALKIWLKENLTSTNLVREVYSVIIEVPNQGLEIYKKEVKAYHEWFKAVTKDFTENELKNTWALLNTPDLTKGTKWTSKLQGMTEILGLTEGEIKKIDEEFFVNA